MYKVPGQGACVPAKRLYEPLQGEGTPTNQTKKEDTKKKSHFPVLLIYRLDLMFGIRKYPEINGAWSPTPYKNRPG
jgi:hypothetical protein